MDNMIVIPYDHIFGAFVVLVTLECVMAFLFIIEYSQRHVSKTAYILWRATYWFSAATLPVGLGLVLYVWKDRTQTIVEALVSSLFMAGVAIPLIVRTLDRTLWEELVRKIE